MIVECRRCRTKYRFDRENLRGEGAWLRCTRCRHVFFLRNPEKETAPEEKAPITGAGEAERAVPFQAETGGDMTPPEQASGEPVQEAERTVSPEEEAAREAERDLEKLIAEGENDSVEADRTSPLKKLFYFLLFLLLLAGGYAILQPEAARTLLDRVVDPVRNLLPFARQTPVSFTAVEEHFLANTEAGRLMVIRGVAVNNTAETLPAIRARARILDSKGETVRESASHGGNILTEEELRTLNPEEMAAILDTPEGRNFPNVQVPPEGTVPFMIVIIDPPENAAEYTIETVPSS